MTFKKNFRDTIAKDINPRMMLASVLIQIGLSSCIVWAEQVAQFKVKEQTIRELKVYITDRAPRIDGRLDESLWKGLPAASGFVDITSTPSFVLNQTIFSVAYDKENLYIGISCVENRLKNIKASTRDRDGSMSHEDSLEIYLYFGRGDKGYFQLGLNTLGTQFDSLVSDAPWDYSWNGKWRCAVQMIAQGWTVEIAIPFSTLGTALPKSNEIFRFNVGRRRFTDKSYPFSSWSVLKSGFHSPRDFGKIIFAGQEDKPQKAEDTLRCNQAYLGSTKIQVGEALLEGKIEIKRTANILGETINQPVREMLNVVETMTTKLEERTKADMSLKEWSIARQDAAKLFEKLAALAKETEPFKKNNIVLPENLRPGIRRHGAYWYLSSKEGIFAIDEHSGFVASIWDSQKGLCTTISHDVYTLETITKIRKADEYFDEVVKSEKTKRRLELVCKNENLPGVRLHKAYWLESNGRILAKEVIVQGKADEKKLLSISSKTVFDKEYRIQSYYNRVLSTAASGGADHRATIAAKAITKPMIQRGGFNQPCGWSQFALVNPERGGGIAQYLYKINDEYVWPPYSLNSSYWNANGWEVSFLATFLKSEPFSSQMRYHLFRGDQLSFYKEYLSLPEVSDVRSAIKVHPSISRMRYSSQGDGVLHALNASFPTNFPRFSVPYSRLRSDETIVFGGVMPSVNLFSYWPNNDEDFLITNEPTPDGPERRIPASDMKRAISKFNKHFPRSSAGIYWTYSDIEPKSKHSKIAKQHSEFAIVGKDGQPVQSLFGYSVGALQADIGRSFTATAVREYERMINYLGFDFYYFDHFGGLSLADWGDGKVVQATDHMHFFETLHEMLAVHDKFIFMNGAHDLYVDVAYAEAMGPIKQMEDTYGKKWWRIIGERLMQFEVFKKEASATILLFWRDYRKGPEAAKDALVNNGREYTNLLLSLGMRPHTCYYDYHTELKTEPGKGTAGGDVDWSAMYNYEEAYQQTSLEMHGTQVADVGLQPAYWNDFDTKIEAYVLKLGGAYFFTANNHHDESRDIMLSADMDRMDMSPENRTFTWIYKRRDDMKVDRLDGPDKPNWDRLFVKVSCQSKKGSVLDGRLGIKMREVEPNLTRMVVASQVPGFIYSVEGQQTQLLIPRTLGCRIEGELNERKKTNRLHVFADKPLQIIAWWPQAWGDHKIEIVSSSGKMVLVGKQAGEITYGNEQFLIISLPKGQTELKISKG